MYKIFIKSFPKITKGGLVKKKELELMLAL